jgi:hypothetical protein
MKNPIPLLACLAGTLALLAPAAAWCEEPSAPNMGGRYSVSGQTVDRDGVERRISGIVSIHQEGDTFTSHSELKTTDPSSEATAAEVIGTGGGKVEGNKLSGQGDIQLVVSEVPGLDVGFGLAPVATTSRRIISTWDATVNADGTIVIETSNVPAEGEIDYRATTTTLKGKRIDPQPKAE